MHHRALRPRRSSRLPGVPAPSPQRAGRRARLALGAALTLGVTGLVLTAPVVSASGDRTASISLDSTASLLAEDVPDTSTSPAPTTTTAPPASTTPAPSTPAPSPEAPSPQAPPVEAPPAAGSAPAEEAPAAAAAAPAAPPAAPGPEGQVLALVNQERAAAGCAPLAADAGLAAVARAHSADMRDRGFFDHVNLDGLDPFDRADRAGVSARAENIARGQQDAAAVMAGWMNSAGHRANILDCSLTRLGVGVADGSGGPWWTQLFG